VSSKLQHALEELYGLERRKNKLGLDGTRALLDALGNPERKFRSVHVAGTNGKGSVCAIVERVLREAGYRTGLFTSPHLVDFRERIRVNGRWADEAWLEQALARIQSLPEGQDRTFFEVVTALGFLYFAEQRVEWAVVEVGLGGRLDTTNVLTPEVCAITSIGLDHQDILGETIEQIAAEKAGIAKPGVPIVLGYMPEPAVRSIEEIAAKLGAIVVRLRDFPEIRPGVASASAILWWNELTAEEVVRTLALRGVTLPSDAWQNGIERSRWPGRLETCPTEPRLWWDGAHNPEAFERLSASFHSPLDEYLIVVLALGRDKNAREIAQLVRTRIRPHLTIVTRTHSERALEVETLRRIVEKGGAPVEAMPDVRSAVERALSLVGDGKVLLTGSLFAVGEAMEAFGGAPGEQL
jgi:dihydrofolate synthase/folylpolyglutamate synthase